MTKKQTTVSKPSYLLQGKNIIIVLNGKSYTISKETHVSYTKILDALKNKDWAVLPALVEPKQAIVNYSGGNVTVKDNEILWKGAKFHNALATRMVTMFKEGFPIDPMVNFMENLMKNPSKRSVDQMYGFLDKNNLPITEDGHFLAYKKVRARGNDMYDIHSGKIRNNVGDKPSMDRNLVDDNPDSLCSSGLHFCSLSYLKEFGNASDPVVIVKVSPADVVSIPTDHNGAKGRCCKYEVLSKVAGDPKDAFVSVIDNGKKESWPFPPMPEVKTVAKTGPVKNQPVRYDLRRKHDWLRIEATNMSLHDAVNKQVNHAYGRKALLDIYIAGTTQQVDRNGKKI